MSLVKYIRQIVDQGDELYSVFAKVLSVDKDNNKCKIQPLRNDESQIEISEIQLGSKIDEENDFIIYPEIGSVVLITWISKQDAFISLYGDINAIEIKANTTITFNGGELGGLPITGALVEKINQLENALNSLITLYNSHIHVTTATVGVGPAVGVIAPTTSTSSDNIVPLTTDADLENDQIKQ